MDVMSLDVIAHVLNGTNEEDLRTTAEFVCEMEARGFHAELGALWEAASFQIREGLEASLLVKSACARLIGLVSIDRTCPVLSGRYTLSGTPGSSLEDPGGASNRPCLNSNRLCSRRTSSRTISVRGAKLLFD
jgi:hypothetical protein